MALLHLAPHLPTVPMKRATTAYFISCIFSAAYSSAFAPAAPTVAIISSQNARSPSPITLNERAVHDDASVVDNSNVQRRKFLSQIALTPLIPLPSTALEANENDASSNKPFHSAAYGQEEYTNSIVASRDTNISPREVYDTIASDYLTNVLDLVNKDGGVARALDVGAGESYVFLIYIV
jgi:hypothetical protein